MSLPALAQPTATLCGSIRNPSLLLSFPARAKHPLSLSTSLIDWVRSLPGCRFDPSQGLWEVTGTGDFPQAKFEGAGFAVLGLGEGEFAGVSSLDQLVSPVTMLSEDKRTVLVRHRLAGYEKCLQLIGPGAAWDRERRLFRLPVSDVLAAGQARAGVLWTQEAVDAAFAAHAATPLIPGLEEAASRLGSAVDREPVEQDIALVAGVLGHYPKWWAKPPMAHQVPGALAVAAGHTLLCDEPGVGKAQPLDEPVLTPRGWRTMGDLSVGDDVVGSDGRPTTVTGVYDQGELLTYRVGFSDGSFTRCSGEHLWSVVDRRHRRRASGPQRTLTTEQILAAGLTLNGSWRFSIQMVQPVRFAGDGAPLPLDPYTLGAILGDGAVSRKSAPTITTDDEIAENLVLPTGGAIGTPHFVATGVSDYYLRGTVTTLRSLGVMERRSESKEIPSAYLLAGVEDRLALLQGLLDTDGASVTGRGGAPRSSVEYGTVSRQLAIDVQFLVQSLGGNATITEKIPTYLYRGERRTGQLYYRMVVSLPSPFVPFRLERKLRKWTPRTKYEPGRRIVSIDVDGVEPSRCIRVAAADHLYVTRSFIVTHNTLSALLAAALTGATRILVTCPPVVATHWSREIVSTGFATEDQVAVVRAGKKVPTVDDDVRAVVMPDSMLTARPAFVAQTIMWEPQWIIVDEAHRFKSTISKRTEALLDMVAMLPDARRVALTGTPVMSGPHELVPLLEFTGHLTPVFGGAGAFLSRYCRQDKYGGWHPDRRHSGELNRQLVANVWVRRTKKQVLPNLPESMVDRVEMTVDLADYRKTHAQILERIDEWVAHCYETDGHAPNEYDIGEYVDTAIQFTSWLRRSAGLSKVKQVTELVREHVTQTTEHGVCTRPMLVWAHHGEVIEALRDALKAPAIDGSTSSSESTALIDRMQAGELPVLICSITAVGAGVTMTRSSDMIFAELDWTPAMMQQALDRVRRIGQRNAITARLTIAEGTLDEHISRVLTDKAITVSAVLGDADAERFAHTPDDGAAKVTPASLVRGMIADRVAAAEASRRRIAA
ncbi:SNF2-related protein [Microbacterium enclense]|uniref:SNF2-related protein n=1 Tax=Microbacterium enclense TaxID=993073 RepID=UPI003F8128A2